MRHAHAPCLAGPLVRHLSRIALAVALLAGSAVSAQEGTLRPEVSKPLAAAQDLLKADKPQDALARLREADAVPDRTPYEDYLLERIRGAAALATKDTSTALAAFTKVLAGQQLPAPERLKMIEGLVGLTHREGRSAEAEQWARRYFAEGGSSEGVRTVLIHTLYAKGDQAALLEQVKLGLAEDEAAKRPVSDTKLQLQAQAQYALKDYAGYRATLERLVQIKPKPDHWAALIDQLQRQPGFQQRLALDMLRLVRQLGLLADADAYLDMAQLAQQAGQPGEAKSVLDEGFAKTLLGQGKDAAAHQQLRLKVNKQAADDQAGLATAQAGAGKAKDGGSLVALGQALIQAGQVDAGLAMMSQGLAKGVARNPDDAKLRYGAALLTQGQRDKALPVLQALTAADGTADLARLWLLAVP